MNWVKALTAQLGYEQVAGLSAVKTLTPPSGCLCAFITAETQDVRWRDDPALQVLLTLASVVANDVVTVNGLSFTAHATTTTVANREFSIAGTDSADATELAVCLNDATYGVPGVTAVAVGATVLLIPKTVVPITVSYTFVGSATITDASSAANPTAAIGQLLAKSPDGGMWYVGDLTKLRFIEAASSAKINVSYYR